MKKGVLICTILTIIAVSINISKINFSEELEDVNVNVDEKLKMDNSVEDTTNSGINSNLYYYSNDVEEDNTIKEETKVNPNNKSQETKIDTKGETNTQQGKSTDVIVKPNENDNSMIKDDKNSEEIKQELNKDSESVIDEKQESNNKTNIEDKKVDSNLDDNTQDKIPSVKEKLNNQKDDTKVKVVDKSVGKMCAQAIDYFYEDAYYKYYFTCKKSVYMYVIKDGKEYKLVDALKNNIVTMQELNDNGYQFSKKSKNLVAK